MRKTINYKKSGAIFNFPCYNVHYVPSPYQVAIIQLNLSIMQYHVQNLYFFKTKIFSFFLLYKDAYIGSFHLNQSMFLKKATMKVDCKCNTLYYFVYFSHLPNFVCLTSIIKHSDKKSTNQ